MFRWCFLAALVGASQEDAASLMQFSLASDGQNEEIFLKEENGKLNVTAPSSQVKIADARADCYQKLVFQGHSRSITQADLDACSTLVPLSHTCGHDQGWTYILDYHDRRTMDDIPDDVTVIQAGFKKESAFFIGNAKLEQMAFTKAEVCVVAEAQSCATSCIDMVALEQHIKPGAGCNINGLSTQLKKALGTFSGQCDSSNANWFNPPPEALKTFPAPYSNIGWQFSEVAGCHPPKARGFSIHAPGNNWHANGNGLTLSRTADRWTRGPTRESQFEFGWYGYAPCGPSTGLDVNILQIRVK